MQGRWGQTNHLPESLDRDQSSLMVAISTMPPPMLISDRAEHDWPVLSDSTNRLQMLLLREHLQLACQFLLLNRDQEADEQICHATEALLRSFGRVGLDLSPSASVWIRNTAAKVLPGVLSAQVDLHRAIDFGDLPSRMTVVLGMHRSGTSALTGMLAQAGLDVPDDLMDRPDDVINLKGYWESEGLMQVNDQLFSDFDLQWSSSDRLPADWSNSSAAAAWRSRLIQQLQRTCRGLQHPVIKDPRICILMEGMRPLLDAGVVSFSFLLPIRHPFAVARSLQAAQGTDLERGIALWIAHVGTAERQTRDQPRLILPFHDLIKQPDGVLSRCRQLFDQQQVSSKHLSMQAAGFIDPTLQRQHDDAAMTELPESAQALMKTAMAMYDVLVGPSGDGAELHQSLDEIRPVDVTSERSCCFD